MFGSFAPAGGVQNRLAHMIPHWVGRGLRVEVVTFRGGELFHRERIGDLVSFHALPARRKTGAVVGLAAYLRRRRPRVVLSCARIPNLINIAAGLLAGGGRRAVVCVTNPPGRSGRESSRWLRRRRRKLRWMRWLYPHARGIIAISEGVKTDLVRLVGLPADRVRVVYNGVLNPLVEKGAAAPPPHPWLEDGAVPVVLSAGRLARQKDYPTLMRAFARLGSGRPARLLVIGEGPERGALERLAEELGITASVRLAGHVENPYAYMAHADLFVMASRWEGFGNVIAEALCLGTPVVATTCPGGPSEILAEGRYGRLVAPGDAAALAAAMAEALDEGRAGAPAGLADHCARFRAGHAALEYLRVMGLAVEGGP